MSDRNRYALAYESTASTAAASHVVRGAIKSTALAALLEAPGVRERDASDALEGLAIGVRDAVTVTVPGATLTVSRDHDAPSAEDTRIEAEATDWRAAEYATAALRLAVDSAADLSAATAIAEARLARHPGMRPGTSFRVRDESGRFLGVAYLDAPAAPAGLRPALVAIDGDADRGVFPALVPARRWNGWAVPLFDRSAVDGIAERERRDDGTPALRWSSADVLLEAQESEGPTYWVTVPRVTIGGMSYWQVGDGWVWAELADDDDDTLGGAL